ncbi:YjgP/YjgQ family permease, partial [bacterium]
MRLRRLDRLIIKEIIGPWVFGVAMFTTLLIAATYLNKIADYIVQGVPVAQIGEILLLLMPAILVKTFAMSTLLAALLAFGRLSGDSEIVALRAAGASLWRILIPVLIFASVIAVVSFFCNERLVPSAAKRSTAIVKELTKSIRAKTDQPVYQTQVEDGRVTMMIQAKEFSLAERQLRGVTLTIYDRSERVSYYVDAKQLQFTDRND